MNVNDLFKKLESIRTKYKEGLIDKTDTLAAMVSEVLKETLENSVDNQKKADDIRTYTGALDKIRQIVRLDR